MERVITKEEILELRRTVGTYRSPVLSLYAHVNPAAPNNHPRAVAVRAKETMKELKVPPKIARRVFEFLNDKVQHAKTLAIFANDDGFDTLGLEVDLPVVDPTTGHVEARWGEPYLTPLLLALDEYQRYGVVFVDSDRWRFFEVFLGQIAEREQAYRAPSAGERDVLQISQEQHPAYIPVRGGAGKDNADWHLLELTRRFFDDALERIASDVAERGVGRLILLGPTEYVRLFESLMPRGLTDRVVERLSSLPSPDMSAHEVLQKVRPVIEEVEARAEEDLLSRVREEGHWGLERCLSELQQGQLYAVVVPWGLDREVYIDRGTGYVATEPANISADGDGQADGDGVEAKPLRDVLPDLALAFGARVEFVRGDRSDRLLGEFGGMAALPRW